MAVGNLFSRASSPAIPDLGEEDREEELNPAHYVSDDLGLSFPLFVFTLLVWDTKFLQNLGNKDKAVGTISRRSGQRFPEI